MIHKTYPHITETFIINENMPETPCPFWSGKAEASPAIRSKALPAPEHRREQNRRVPFPLQFSSLLIKPRECTKQTKTNKQAPATLHLPSSLRDPTEDLLKGLTKHLIEQGAAPMVRAILCPLSCPLEWSLWLIMSRSLLLRELLHNEVPLRFWSQCLMFTPWEVHLTL